MKYRALGLLGEADVKAKLGEGVITKQDRNPWSVGSRCYVESGSRDWE